MKYVKWTILTLLALIVFAFFHYTLPQHDIVRIVNTNTQRIDVGENSWFWSQNDQGMNATVSSRDVKFIETIRPNGKPLVYRNEDTGWIWPPYFKFDSYDVQTEASNLKSDTNTPRWVSITHYGWRNQYFTIFPNAISIREVAGPDVSIIPWFNIVFFVLLLVVILFIRRMWLQFRERTIDPALQDAGAAWDQVEGRAEMAGKRAKGWFSGWRK
jgi:hypothetical protein